jgi:adenosine deaminase
VAAPTEPQEQPRPARARLGRALRAIRNGLGISLAEVALRTGVSVSTLSKVENSQRSLTYDKLVQLSEGLKVEKFDVGFGLIVSAMRNEPESLSFKLAELAVAYRSQGCVGFDLAGEEAGHPAKEHVRAFEFVKRQNFSITIHAGESFGPESIWQALQYCGAHRIGHGTRLIEDIVVYDGKVIQLGHLAQFVLDHRIPIEVCLSSNVHTGAARSIEEHPFLVLMKQKFRVTLNTDNRLMSRTSMTDECMLAVQTFGLNLADLEKIAINGMKSAFAHYDERVRLIYERIKPGYAKLREGA